MWINIGFLKDLLNLKLKSFILQLLEIVTFYYLYFSVIDIEVACYGYEGIDAVKEALRAGLNCSTENMPIKVSVSLNNGVKSKVF